MTWVGWCDRLIGMDLGLGDERREMRGEGRVWNDERTLL
jgi:hypothetical protein